MIDEALADAKREILQYLGRMQIDIIREVDDVKERLETLLLIAGKKVEKESSQITSIEIRLAEKELDRAHAEECFRRRMRMVSAALGTALIVVNVLYGLFLISSKVLPTLAASMYMLGLSIVGGILILIAVAYERVSAFLGARVSND